MMNLDQPMAVCGLDCSGCALWKAACGDRQAAEHLADWWRSKGWIQPTEGADYVLQHGPHCLGCHGDRTKHWSANCWILHCCVDERGLSSCHECADFPCARLVEWAKGDTRYAEALSVLRRARGPAA